MTRLIAAIISLTATPMFAADAGVDFFEKSVRPLLIEHCYECHSEKTGKRKGGLWLDRKAGWVDGGDSGAAIVPGKPEESLLIDAVRYESYEMPPKGKLSDEAIAVFEKWIQMGAPDPRDGDSTPATESIDFEKSREFWAFQPPRRHDVPDVGDSSWPADDIDRFVLSRLRDEGLTPVGDADPETWLRRITFDLTGLPPTPQEIESFIAAVSDDAEAARASVVDRLLDSPHFGEHWGRHWLDIARYADSNGGDINLTFFNSWRYRDYVVNAFNNDKPFDEFVREQIAGDLMSAETRQRRTDQLIGTGFLIVGPKMLSERNKEKLHMDVVDEQLDTIGRAFMGLTLGCARCHDHKFDPIPNADYYAMAGILRSTETVSGIRMGNVNVSGWFEQRLPMSDEVAAAVKDYETQKDAISKKLKTAKKNLADVQQSTRLQPEDLIGIVVDDTQATLVGTWKNSTFTPRYVGKGYIHDDKQDLGNKSVTFEPELPTSGEFEVRISFAAANGRASNGPVTITSSDGTKTIIVDQEKTPEIGDLFKSLGRFRFGAGTGASVTITNKDTNGYVIVDAAQFIPAGLLEQENVQTVSDDAIARRGELQKQVKSIEAEMKKLNESAPAVPMAMSVRDRREPGNTTLRVRGEPDSHGDAVPRGFLQVLRYDGTPTVNPDQSGRLELANWVADRRNPLTARVIVNRIWSHLMGQGIVASVDNFGQLGNRPSHPKLLDQLAVDLMDNGWSLKSMIRRVALSRTYRLSTESYVGAASADPENQLRWRQNRRRLPAESIRDALLAVSGRIDRTVGGSSVAGMGEQAVQNSSGSKNETNQGAGSRRSLYLPIVRNDLPTFLTVFDFADPDVVTGRRSVTNVPAQALLMLNSPFVRDCAKAMAERLVTAIDPDDSTRVNRLYFQAFGRSATESEIARAINYLRQQNAGIENDETQASRIDAWAWYCQTLLASSEFRMLD